MEQLKVIGTEDGSLVLADKDGTRFRVAVDDTLHAEIRRARTPAPTGAKVSPKDIQAQIRAGLSAEEVAALLGTTVEDVVRYEAPVLAERDYVVGQALSVPVLTTAEFEEGHAPTFGNAVRAKLAEAGASGERWTSWKDPEGWMVKLTFTVGEVDRDARWSFDPRRSVLSPLNADATQLSRQGSLPEGLIPRLRALEVPGIKDDTRFDSGAFGPRALPEQPAEASRSAVQDAAIKRSDEVPATSPETADLLEALRRRRGQRTAAPSGAEPETSPAPLALFDALDGDDEADAAAPTPRADAASDQPRRKGGRSSMPSWDEIVFGARGDEG